MLKRNFEPNPKLTKDAVQQYVNLLEAGLIQLDNIVEVDRAARLYGYVALKRLTTLGIMAGDYHDFENLKEGLIFYCKKFGIRYEVKS